MRSIFFTVLIIVSSQAQALDIFNFFSNALHNRKNAPDVRQLQQSENSDSWENSVVIDLSPKKPVLKLSDDLSGGILIKPSQSTAQVPTQSPDSIATPFPKPVTQQGATQAPIPVPVPVPVPASAPAYEIVKPEVFKEKTVDKAPIPNWTEDKKAHWQEQVRQYYNNYLGTENNMSAADRETKLQENAIYFDPQKVASLDPNKFVLPLDGKSTTGRTEVKWRLEPLLYFNLDSQHRIINLTPYTPKPDDQKPTLSAGKIVLQPAGPSPLGYQVFRKETTGIGAGPALQSVIDWNAPGFSSFLQLGVHAGALALINSVQSINRKVIDPNTDILTYATALPTVDNIVNKWDIGQSYSYGLSGGLLLTVGMHFMAMSLGPTYVKMGTAEHVVTKLASNKVMVEIVKLDTSSGSATATAGIIAYSQILKNDIERTKNTYFYDLSMDAGRKAFEQIMIGNYFDTEALVAENKTVAVAQVERDINKTYMDRGGKDFGRAWYVGIPFIYWNWTKGKQTNEGYIQNFADAVETRYYHGVYYDNFHRRIIRLHKSELEMFYTGIENSGNSPAVVATTQDYYARYVWNLQDETMTRRNLRSELNEMIYFRTGLEELDVNESALSKNLMYGNAEVIMDFDKGITDAIMLHLEGGGSDFYNEMNRTIDDYAKRDYPDDLDVCDTLKYNAYRSIYNEGGPTKAQAKADCIVKIRANTKEIVKQMYDLVMQMFTLSRKTDDKSKKDFAQVYRDFGRLMMTDRFTFRTIYNLLVDDRVGDFLRFTVNGENMANMTIYFPSGQIGLAH